MKISRGFVDVAEGQVHFRRAGQGGEVPLVMIHASPGSSKMLSPLILACAAERAVIASDTLGNGDSSAPFGTAPDLADFADGHLRALTALGVERFDLYGTHTGAGVAVEMAIAAPGRVRRVVLDGMSLYTPDECADMLRHYAPGVPIDLHGSQFNWVWHFVRDVYLFWPWYRRDAAHRRDVGLPSAMVLHDKAVEVLKALDTYHLSYLASIGYDKRARLPLIPCPALVTCNRSDMLWQYFEAIIGLVPGGRHAVNPGIGSPEAAQATARLLLDFFAEPQAYASCSETR